MAEIGDLNNCRPYLLVMARMQMGAQLQGKLDASDIVQQTLLRAHEKRDQFRGQSEGEWLGWLRQILANQMAETARRFHAEARDIQRERPLEMKLEESSARLEAWLVASGSSPSQKAMRSEEVLRLCTALHQLPDEQRLAVELHHLKGLSVGEVSELMGKTKPAIMGLLFRGLKKLRGALQAAEGSNHEASSDR